MGTADAALNQQALTLSLVTACQQAGLVVPPHFSIEVPNKMEHGDLTTDLALRAAQHNGRSSPEVAEAIMAKLRLPAAISQVRLAGPGFLNFALAKEGWRELLTSWLNGRLFQSGAYAKQTVVVEYSSPNVGKPFSVGHLRSTILGDVTARLHERSAARVIRVNHLGDFGTQFGKLIVALERFGDLDNLGDDPIATLVKLYVRFHDEAATDARLDEEAREWFARLEQGDKEARRRWRAIVAVTITEFKRLYKRLGITFDHLDDRGESFYTLAMMQAVLEELQRAGLTQISNGATVLKFPDEALPSTVLVRRDGATVYLLRDLAALKYRLEEWAADRIIVHVGDDQTLHFRQLNLAGQRLGWFDRPHKPQMLVAHHGMYRLQSGKMSTRHGRSVLLQELFDHGVEQAKTLLISKNPSLSEEELKQRAEWLAIGAIKYNDLSHHRASTIIFDWSRALNLEGNSAPYLMYTHARAHGIFRQAGQTLADISVEPAAADQLTEPRERQLLLKGIVLHQSFLAATKEAQPHLLAEQLYQLASLFNSYYGETRIVTDDVELTKARLALVKAVAVTLGDGLTLLGLSAPTEL